MNNRTKIHTNFKLNGQHFLNVDELILYIKHNQPTHANFIKDFFDNKDFIIAHTSGSTGIPKEIVIQKKYLINSAQNTINYFNLTPQTSALLNLSSDFIAGKMMWIRALIGGWHLDIINAKNEYITTKLANNHYDFGAMVPLQAYQNINYLNNISKIIIGGGRISDELFQKLQNLSNKCYATYGMTETVTHIAIKKLNGQKTNDYFEVLSNIRISIDHRNCLIINAPKLSSKQIVTNDIVEIIDKKHFNWLGRYDNIINSGGVKIITEQIEQKLSPHISPHFFIGSLPDQKLGEKVVLFIEGKMNTSLKLDYSELLNKYQVPRQTIFIDKFIRTSNGKINRHQTIAFYQKKNHL